MSKDKDILETLRFCAHLHPQAGYPENGKIFAAAADEIERLRRVETMFHEMCAASGAAT